MKTIFATEVDIAESIEAGEILLISYHGGSKPGTIRELLPLQVIDKAKFRARCLTSSSVKTFMIGKVEILERKSGEAPRETWDKVVAQKDIPAPVDPQAIAPDCHQEWINKGWHVSFYQLDWCEGGFGCGVHRKKKVGSGHMKNPTHCLEYRPFTTEFYVAPSASFDDEGGMLEQTRPSKQPWYTGKRAYANYGTALQKFIDVINGDSSGDA